MNELKIEQSPYIIIDKNQNVKRFGEYSGGILTKLVGSKIVNFFREINIIRRSTKYNCKWITCLF